MFKSKKNKAAVTFMILSFLVFISVAVAVAEQEYEYYTGGGVCRDCGSYENCKDGNSLQNGYDQCWVKVYNGTPYDCRVFGWCELE